MPNFMAPASRPTLRKTGADLRWLLEKSGINPENALVTIGVPSKAEMDRLSQTLVSEFEGAVMTRDRSVEHMVQVMGVRIIIHNNPELKTLIGKKIDGKPPEPA